MITVLRLYGPRERTRMGPAFSTLLAGCLVVNKPLLFHALESGDTHISLTNENAASGKDPFKSLRALQKKHVTNVRIICESR